MIFGFSAFTFITGQFRGCRCPADRHPLARAGPPALKGTVPPRRTQASGPSALFQPLVSSRRARTPGSPSRRGGGQPPDARVPRPWLAAPGVPSPGDKGPLSPLLCGGGGAGAPLHNGGLSPPGGGARQTPKSPPALGQWGAVGVRTPGLPPALLGGRDNLWGPRHLGPEEPTAPTSPAELSLFPSPGALIPAAASCCPHSLVPPMAPSPLHLGDDSVSPPPGVPRACVPVPPLSPCPCPSAVPVMETPW